MEKFCFKLQSLKSDIEQCPENYSIIIEKVDYPVCVISQYGEFVAVNEAYCKFYKYLKSDLIGKNLFIILSEELLLDIAFQHDKFFRDKMEKVGGWDDLTKAKERLLIKACSVYTESIKGKPHRIIGVKNLYSLIIEKAEIIIYDFCFLNFIEK